jgi:hypothetical protein
VQGEKENSAKKIKNLAELRGISGFTAGLGPAVPPEL